jgi:hypothetical protein
VDVTVTVRTPMSAAELIVTRAVTVSRSTTVTSATETPVPLMATVVAPETKWVPLSVIGTDAPAPITTGSTLPSVGTGGTTVKVNPALLVPPVVVTETLRAPSAASPAIVSVARAIVALCTSTSLTATPSPLTATAAVAPTVKLLPVMVIGTAVPVTPCGGVTAAVCGAGIDGAVGDAPLLHPTSVAQTTAARKRIEKVWACTMVPHHCAAR